jgi:hypothetical protein
VLAIDEDLKRIVAWCLELKLDHVQDQLGKGRSTGPTPPRSRLRAGTRPLGLLCDDQAHPLSPARFPEWGSVVLLLQPSLPNDVAYWQLIRPTDIVHVTGGAPGALMISIVPDRCTVMGSCPARRRTAAVSVGLSTEGG